MSDFWPFSTNDYIWYIWRIAGKDGYFLAQMNNRWYGWYFLVQIGTFFQQPYFLVKKKLLYSICKFSSRYFFLNLVQMITFLKTVYLAGTNIIWRHNCSIYTRNMFCDNIHIHWVIRILFGTWYKLKYFLVYICTL